MSLRISRVLHAGYLFQHEDTTILFDPIFEKPFSRNCFPFPDVEFDQVKIMASKFDAVFISHYHDDHCSFDSLDLLNRDTPIFIYCIHEEMLVMLRELGFKSVTALATDRTVKVGSIEVTPRLALDSDVDSIFQISAGGVNVLNVVDAWIDPAAMDILAKSAPLDMVLWPFQTMQELQVLSPSRFKNASPEIPSEWFDQLRILKPRYIVPSSCQFIHESWSWYNHAMFPISYRDFENEIRGELPDSRILRLNPSVSVDLDADKILRAPPIDWVLPQGEQDIDYDFQPRAIVPEISEVSKHFRPLSAIDTEKVLDFCRGGLVAKYQSLEPSAEKYFESPRIWNLALFDHRGVKLDFYYEVRNANLKLLTGVPAMIHWRTEVSVSKIYSALHDGESLTSMYVRINDTRFDEATEAELRGIDLLQDPLVRSLFTGAFGAYQAAQLKKIKRSEA